MDSFEILSGVRRAKAAESSGHATVVAVIFDPNGHRVDTRDIPLASLLSPKDILDLRASAAELIRFRRLQSLLLAGVVLDPIEVVAGTRGTPLSQVRVLI